MKKSYSEGRKNTIGDARKFCTKKLTNEQIIEIRAATGTHESISKNYPVSRRMISYIKQGNVYK